ncbi:hypothetical protein [Streptomyces europaeiscabiei]|nr:hypothetical protein [Streptomyces europaeiscabiei]
MDPPVDPVAPPVVPPEAPLELGPAVVLGACSTGDVCCGGTCPAVPCV